MPKFWKHKPDKPVVHGYTGWCYSLEYYGVTFTCIDIEQLRISGEQIAKHREGRYFFSYLPTTKKELLMYLERLRILYIHTRHRKEISNLYREAYRQFSSESEV